MVFRNTVVKGSNVQFGSHGWTRISDSSIKNAIWKTRKLLPTKLSGRPSHPLPPAAPSKHPHVPASKGRCRSTTMIYDEKVVCLGENNFKEKEIFWMVGLFDHWPEFRGGSRKQRKNQHWRQPGTARIGKLHEAHVNLDGRSKLILASPAEDISSILWPHRW